MPIFSTKVPPFKTSKDTEKSWDNFRGGLNVLLRETELKDNELSQADNIILTGSGIPTKRWGTKNYFLAGATGSNLGLGSYYKSDTNPELLTITDWGYLTKKSGSSYTMITGASWASGYPVEMTQLDNKMYFVSASREMVRFDGVSLVGFPTVATPSNVFATQISNASGTNTYSYRVSATTAVGETLASAPYRVASQPQDLLNGAIKVSWTAPSAASGVLKAFNIYGRTEGDERFLGSVDWQSTQFIDDGAAIPQSFTFPPLADTTGGPKAKYIIRFQDRLVYAGLAEDGSKVIISGHAPLHERIDLSYGGNYIRIEPDAGDNVTGLCAFEDKIIVFKEKSIWQVSLSTIKIDNFYVTLPEATLITRSYGCIAPRSIAAVENDIFFLSRDGVFVLGYEPNVLANVLRTNEVSARIRPILGNIPISQKRNACAVYFNKQYILSFPGSGKSFAYDRERICWLGPWTFDAKMFEKHYDADGNERLVFGRTNSPYIGEVSNRYEDDDGATIQTTLRMKKEDFGDWSLFKTIKDVFVNLRNVKGNVDINVRLEKRDGNEITAKSFNVQTVSSNAGWGADLWGNAQWGDSEESGGGSDINDLVRWVMLNKMARTYQVEVKTVSRNDNYELLGIRTRAKPISRGFTPSSWKVT